MIRRTERNYESSSNGVTTHWRITTVYLFGLTVYRNQVERGTHGTLLTRQQVAKLLGVGMTTVYQLQQEGKLPVVKIGSSVRYRPDDVRHLVDTMTK